jgi:adenylylsulfate kinase
MKILVMGLPGAGKTWLSERLQKALPECAWYNADKVRGMANDWDFSPQARLRQAERMRNIADFEDGEERTVICDFVCPLVETRNIFDADVLIWVNTLDEGRYDDTNKMFEKPNGTEAGAYYEVTSYMSDKEIEEFAKNIEIPQYDDSGLAQVFGDSDFVPNFLKNKE